ncbi:MAG: SirB1 family protein [Candidatus Dormibacteria bacterium]
MTHHEGARANLLAAATDPDAEIASAALWIDAEDYPDVDRGACLDQLGEMASELRTRGLSGDVIDVIGALLRDRVRLRGAGGGDPRAHYLHHVLERGSAVPIACAAVWMAVGRRAGVNVEGVGLPGHFVIRVEGTLVDAASGAERLDESDVRRIVSDAIGRSPEHLDPSWLEPASVRSILVRMSHNLRACHASLENWDLALLAADRCVELLPDRAIERRDRGLLLWRMGRNQAALNDLRYYLECSPEASDVQGIQGVVGRLRSFMN